MNIEQTAKAIEKIVITRLRDYFPAENVKSILKQFEQSISARVWDECRIAFKVDTLSLAQSQIRNPYEESITELRKRRKHT